MNLEEIKPNLYKLDEQTHLRKNKNEYRLIYPIRDSKGNINLKNLFIGGKWSNLFLILFVVSLLFYLSWGHKADLSFFEEYIEENCPKLDPYGYTNISKLRESDNEYNLLIPASDNDEILN